MRAWVFLHRKGSYIKRGNTWTALYDEDTEFDRSRSVRELFPESVQFTNEGEITPMMVLLNAYCNNDERIHMLGPDCMYYGMPYILSLINVDLNAADMLELELSEEDIGCVIDVTGFKPLPDTKEAILSSVEKQVGLIGLINTLKLEDIVGWYRMARWGRNILFDLQKLHRPENPSIRCPISVAVDGTPLRHNGAGSFTQMNQFDVYEQKMKFGMERAEKDMTLATALEVCCKKHNSMLLTRSRQLKINHDDWGKTYIYDILPKREEGGESA